MPHEEQNSVEPPFQDYKITWSRFAINYREGDYLFVVGKEYVLEEDYTAVYPDFMDRWSTPHQEEKPSEQKKAQILERVERKLQEWGKKYKIVYRETKDE